MVPWNGVPTTTVSIAPFWSGAIGGGIFLTSAGANSLATDFAAAFATLHAAGSSRPSFGK